MCLLLTIALAIALRVGVIFSRVSISPKSEVKAFGAALGAAASALGAASVAAASVAGAA